MQHDVLVIRLSQILFRLNQGEKLTLDELAQEFNVNLRTIQRDFNERLSYLPIDKTNGKYHLNPAYLGRIGAHNIQNFASLAGIRGLFPKLDIPFLKKLYEEDRAYQVHGQRFEEQTPMTIKVMHDLEHAIYHTRTISLDYIKSDGQRKDYDHLHPYRLINHQGIWYVGVSDQGIFKALAITRIQSLQQHEATFQKDAHLEAILDEEDGIWLGEKTKVTLLVTGNAVHYFHRRPLLPKQKMIEMLADSIIISTEITHVNQLFPILNYWLPFVKILHPTEIKSSFEAHLRTLVDRYFDESC